MKDNQLLVWLMYVYLTISRLADVAGTVTLRVVEWE